MQPDLLLFLALLAAHLLGDFVLQTKAMVTGKSDGSARAFLLHGAAHYALAYAAVLLFVPELLAQPVSHALLLLLVVLHLGADLLKERALAAFLSPRLSFVVDQLIHVLLLFLVAFLFAGGLPTWASAAHVWFEGQRDDVLWLLVVYLATIFGGGYFIRLMLPADDPAHDGDREAVERGGMYIGWLERFVILTAVLAKSPTLIGLIITAKSIVRFKKLDSDRFAEYYLLGTFLSLALALAGGLLLLRILGTQAVTGLE